MSKGPRIESPTIITPATAAAITGPVLAWYAAAARDLPWRRADRTAWGVMVSEFMLQQTPVARVLEPWQQWLTRWPQPIDLALAPAGEAVRAWGRLGYPRRALRLHAAATEIVERHDGVVPAEEAELRALPGVGAYTAAAIASFAHGRQAVVLDTNVRRVIARAVAGSAQPPPSPTVAERALAESLIPAADPAGWAAASMELGALVCTATGPDCAACPLRDRCRWVLLGRPAYAGPPRRGQAYAGTDRQVRGLLLGVLREHDGPVEAPTLDAVWADSVQRERALGSLVDDGLAIRIGDNHYGLPR
ncbi:A/G-specific adenine glycosylase [Granulicoccus phenolivorans]|uniref:A/G-specific adenine glycosylase n=1 Tax=Granulicoccus phenolivorans TaxID=266854 RepID=UPI000400F0F9|nr:A/G-specific adenine glycosylase [Granulicoccus phenolivorans]